MRVNILHKTAHSKSCETTYWNSLVLDTNQQWMSRFLVNIWSLNPSVHNKVHPVTPVYPVYPVHHYTETPIHQYNSTPVHQYSTPVQQDTKTTGFTIPLPHHTSTPEHQYTSTPLHQYTSSPLHHYASTT